MIASHQWTRCAQPNDERPGMNAEWFMPWEHVEYKLHRMWQTVAPPPPLPSWRPTNGNDQPQAPSAQVRSTRPRILRLGETA